MTFFLILGLGTFYIMNTGSNDPRKAAELLAKNTSVRGELLDYAGDIDYHGNAGYEYLENGDFRIYFGNLQFDMKPKDFEDEKLIGLLNKSGITFKKSKKTGKLYALYKGEKLDEYSNR